VETASFTISGMTCAIGCAKTIQDELSETDGVQKATVDFDKKAGYGCFRQFASNSGINYKNR